MSITAIAVAPVVATKELLLCLLGTVLVRSSRAFVIGDWIDAEAKLLARVNALTAPFAETARRYNTMLENRTGIDIPDAGASIEFATNDIAKFVTTITVFCPIERIVELEGAMMREFFEWYRMHRGRPNGCAPAPDGD